MGKSGYIAVQNGTYRQAFPGKGEGWAVCALLIIKSALRVQGTLQQLWVGADVFHQLQASGEVEAVGNPLVQGGSLRMVPMVIIMLLVP